MVEKFSFGEGVCLNEPPLFCGMNYDLWCIRMKFFIESIDRKFGMLSQIAISCLYLKMFLLKENILIL